MKRMFSTTGIFTHLLKNEIKKEKYIRLYRSI